MPVKQRSLRDEPPLRPQVHLLRALVAGEELTRSELRRAAQDNYAVYGFFGVSVFSAEDDVTRQELLTRRFVSCATLADFRAGHLNAGGMRLLPTGNAPHHDIVVPAREWLPRGDNEALDELVDRLLAVPHTVVRNEFFDPEGGQR